MGFVTYAKRVALKQGGRHGIRTARKVGRLIAPKLTRRIERFTKMHKRTFDDLGAVAQSATDLPTQASTGDIEGGVDSVKRGLLAGRRLAGDLGKARRSIKSMRKRRSNAMASVQGRESVNSGGGSAPGKSGDSLERMQKLARIE